MLHLVRFITWLLLFFLPLSNQLAVSKFKSNEKTEKELVDRLPRYYQRTILHGLIQSQANLNDATKNSTDINPQEVYTFLQTSGAILSTQISGETFQEIKDKLEDTLAKPMVNSELLIDLSGYKATKDKEVQEFLLAIGNAHYQTTCGQLFERLSLFYREFLKGHYIMFFYKLQGKELGPIMKRQVRMTLDLIVIHKIQADDVKGNRARKERLEAYQKSPLDRHLLYAFLVEAMQDADSNVIIDPSFRDYLVKLGLFDTAFNPTVKVKDWDFRQARRHPCEIPSELSMYYEGGYRTLPVDTVPETAELSLIAREWTQAYNRYLKEKLYLDNLEADQQEFMNQRQTEFLCGFVVAFKRFSSSVPLNSQLSNDKTPVQAECTSWSCFLKIAGLGTATGVGIWALYTFRDDIIKLVFPTGKGTTRSNPNTTRPLTGPPEIDGSSRTLWWILSIGGVVALLGLAYWKYYNSRDDESSETEKEKVPKKKTSPKLKKQSKKERSKVKVKKGVAKKKLLPLSSSPVSKATPSSVVSSSPQTSSPSSSPVSPSSAAPTSNASTATLTSQTGTESLATQTASPKAAANKKLNKPDVSKSRKGTTSAFPVSVAPSKGAQFSAASTLPQTSKVTLTKAPTWDTPTLKTTLALPSNASKQTQTPSSVAPHTKLSQPTQKMKHSNAATNPKKTTSL